MKKKMSVAIGILMALVVLSCSPGSGSIGEMRPVIEKIDYGSSSQSFDYTGGLLRSISWNTGPPLYRNQYDDQDRIIRQQIDFDKSYEVTNLTYEGDELSTVEINDYDDHNFEQFQVYIEMTSPDNYLVYDRVMVWTSDVVDSEVIYEVQLEFDSEGHVTKYTETDTEFGFVQTLEFTYSNGNLTRVIENGEEDMAWEITYDDKHNYLALLDSYKTDESIPVIPFSEVTKRKIGNIPHFFDFNNRNNVLRVTYGGEELWNYNYEYNPVGFPVRANYSAFFGDGSFEIEYSRK